MPIETLQQKIESEFRRRCVSLMLRPGTDKRLREQASFFAGAMAVMHAQDPEATFDKLSKTIPPSWVICIMSGRDILKEAGHNV